MREETRQNFLAAARENRFRVKLHPVDWELAMPQCHHFAVVAFSDYFEAPWKGNFPRRSTSGIDRLQTAWANRQRARFRYV